MQPYTLDDALEELFLDRAQAEDILLLWRAKNNIILQGPPGVGKSFAAHKLAFALMGVEDRERLGFVQFHQSYSYEDFVEGFRPASSGFELKAGKFIEFCRRAEADPNRAYVFIIDEINRGNLSKILGELMLLIEPDKRDQKWAMPLASGKAPFHVPANVYIMGLMNTADRSLAVVDYALRRRFAFFTLGPNLNSPRFEQHLESLGIGEAVRAVLRSGIGQLNDEIIRRYRQSRARLCHWPQLLLRRPERGGERQCMVSLGTEARRSFNRFQLWRAATKPFQFAIASSTGASAREVRMELAMMMPAVACCSMTKNAPTPSTVD